MSEPRILEILDVLSLYKAFRDPEQYDIAEMLHEGLWWYRLHPSLSADRKPDVCDEYNGRQFTGSSIPDLFPFHEHSNDDPDLIFANVHPNCLATGSPILTLEGFKPIENVQVGDYVWTHKERWRQVTRTHAKEVQDNLRIINGIGLTGNHRVLTSEGWMEADLIHRDTQILLTQFNQIPAVQQKKSFLSLIKNTLSWAVMPMSRVDFNSDFLVWDSKINVEGIDSIFANHGKSSLLKGGFEKNFPFGGLSPFLLNFGSKAFFSMSDKSAFRRFMRGLILSSPLFRCHSYPTDFVNFAHGHPSQSFHGEFPGESYTSNPELFSQLFHRDTFLPVQPVDFPDVNIFSSNSVQCTFAPSNTYTMKYKGIVHNLTVNQDESYLATSIFVHNCKCTLTTTKRAPPIRDYGPELLGLPEEQPEPIGVPEEI